MNNLLQKQCISPEQNSKAKHAHSIPKKKKTLWNDFLTQHVHKLLQKLKTIIVRLGEMRELHTKSLIAQFVYFPGFSQKIQNKAECRLNLIFNLNTVGYIYNTTQNLKKLLKNSVFFSHIAFNTHKIRGDAARFLFSNLTLCAIYTSQHKVFNLFP